MTKYQYASLLWQMTTNWADIRFMKLDRPAQTWTYTYFLKLPGEEMQELEGERTFPDVASELGADGWRLVSESVTKSTILDPIQGVAEASYPVEVSWKFIREVQG